MTHILQLLDLTVNKYAKYFTKCKFTAWFQEQLNIALERGDDRNEIEISYHLSVLKPFYARWIVDLYNHMTT